MSEKQGTWHNPFLRGSGRGCGIVFFFFIAVLGGAWGAVLGGFVSILEDAQTQITTLDTYRPKEGSRFYDSKGEPLGEYSIEVRRLVKLGEIPLNVQKAFVATEDDRFFEHKGVRPESMFKAFLDYLQKSRMRGASTITMQLVRGVEEVTGVSTERTPSRKAKEIIVALQLEREYTKDEILELYLNMIFLGGSAYGVEAASYQYFGKSCRDVTLAEAATLAGLTRSPNQNRPDRHPENAGQRRNIVLQQMLTNGFITQQQHDEAVASSVLDSLVKPDSREAMMREGDGYWGPNQFKAPYFVEEARQMLAQQGIITKTDLIEQGLEVRTTLDMRLQRAAEEIMEKALSEFDEKKMARLTKQNKQDEFEPVAGALICIDNRKGYEGYVRALVGGRDFATEKYNTVTQAVRQPGSSFKPYVWLAAIADGATPANYKSDYAININGYAPGNFDGTFVGPVTLRYALEQSINTVAVQLLSDVGIPSVRSYMEKIGVRTPVDTNAGLSLALGSSGMTVMDQAVSYSTLAKNGTFSEPIFVTRIIDRDGFPIYEKSPELTPDVIPPNVSFVLTYMLEGVATRGTGARTGTYFKRPRAGKTGTTNDARDVWFCGFTPQFTCVVWIGYRSNKPLGSGADYTGGRMAAPIWGEFMAVAHQGMPEKDFDVPKGVEFHEVDLLKRVSRYPAYAGTIREAFITGTYPPPPPPSEETEEEMLEGEVPPADLEGQMLNTVFNET
ncbi:MAG: hypothetical protein AMXMBFR84_20090 [Candidatus Hydrogenedentota bacterium]